MILDKDLASIQEARDLLKKASVAQKEFAKLSQDEVDKVIKYISERIYNDSEVLAKLAVKETGFGNVKDKIFKNQFASRNVYDYIKDMRTRGIINIDDDKKMWEIATPFGVVVGLIPSTNPTSTVIYKTLISLKSGNGIVFSPHPSALDCISLTVDLIRKYLKDCSVNEDLVSVLSNITMEGTNTLMTSDDADIILATGGGAMVKAAYSSGTPALGVGPGNVPTFIEKSADIKKAVSMIIDGKTFDNGVICASEQSVIVEESIKAKVIEEFKKQNCYFLNDEEKRALEKVIVNPVRGLNPRIVGKTPVQIASMAGISVDEDVKVLIAFEKGVGRGYPFSMEKLSPLLAFYVEDNWKDACEKCIELLEYGGMGHSLSIHSKDLDVIKEFALLKPVSRMLVNTPATHGAIGVSTNLAPALTLGCGSVGGSSTSDNVTPLNLFNIRRVAFGIEEETKEDISIGESQLRSIIEKVIRELN